MLSYLDDRGNSWRHIQEIWTALQAVREANLVNDNHWDDICTAMAWITEDLDCAYCIEMLEED